MRTTIQAVALSVIAMTSGNALALHRQTPFEMADTTLPGGQSLAPFSQGESARFISFHSLSDLLGNGSGGGEIFLFDNEPPRSTSQITNCALGDSANASTVANGKTIVFDSTSDLAKPASQRCKAVMPRRQIMRATVNQGQVGFEQLTNNLSGDCTNARISADGFKTIFQCTGDLRRNGSSGTHIFLFRDSKDVCDPLSIPVCSKAQQITPKGFGSAGNAEMNLLADKIVFNSAQAIDGKTNGFQQIWLYDITARTPFPSLERLTDGAGDSTNPSMNQDGSLVVFQSTANLLGTGSSGSELFLLNRTTGVLRQLTNGDGDSTEPSMGGGGRFIIFLSTSNFAAGSGLNAGTNVYLYDLIEDVTYQVTQGPGSGGHPIATADTIFFFDSDQAINIDGNGGIPGRQIYTLNVFQQVPPRALGPAKMRLLPGKEVTPGVVGGSSVRIITQATYGGDPASSFIVQPIGNPASGAGEIDMAILGRNIYQEGQVAVPKAGLIIPPVLVPSFGAVCFQQNGPGTGTVDCNGDADENKSQPDLIDYRTLQDHVTNNPGSTPAEDPSCQLGCREGINCPGPLQPPPPFECPRCKAQAGVCADGPNQGQACQFDSQCPGKERVVDPGTGATLVPGSCDLTTPQTDPVGVAHLGTCRGVGSPRENKWCDLDSDCPSNCLAQATCDGGPAPGGTCDSDRDCDPNQQCDNGKIDICQGPSVLNQSGAYRPGDLELEVPMTAKLAVAPGPDGQYCTGDDTYALSGVGLDSILRLTTGKATATISDVNYTAGTMGASEEGAPFDCEEWQNNKNLSGGRLVGALTFLNVPSIPFKGDTILTFRFQADTQACVGGTCPQPCTDDVQCSDADPCNGREFCYLNTCQPGVPVTCDDGDQCNGREACNESSGLCDPSNGVACDDDNPCTTGTCRPDFLCTYHNEPDDKACNDGDLCTGPDPVTGGICTINNCDHCETGVCTGSPTTQTPGQPGAPAAECENNNRCDGIMACDPATGNSCIQKVPPLTCVADTNPCTDDVCDPALGCNPPSPVTTACDDGSLCTVNDHCDGQRQCVGDPLECQQPASVCDGFNSCNRLSGACELTPLDCNDLNPCTIDSCFDDGTKTPATACVHDAPGAAGLACDDQSACTDTDQCNATGQCVGTLSAAAALCNAGDGNACNGTEACDPVGGGCLRTPLNCDDADPCTTDSCDPTVGCKHDQLTGLCDDGNACTVGDTCASGRCLGAPTQVALTCGNTTVCDGIETCDPGTGTCLPGTPLVCDDSDECTTETCDPVAGCVSTAQPGLEGALCELDALREEIKGRPFGSITGKRLPRKLSRLVLRARVKVKLATRASNPKAVTLLTAADKKLQRFQILVKKGFGFDRITEALMHQTTDRTQNARTITQTYKANLR